ncbi:carbohydrate ABC transporter substrate-binding protein, CUT1 family [Halobacillus alkaliphilus]|uniref:Carbohydrate ABC transporter substrate-binding protein, CUT1 family n=1 Tax=Halobacillus alkaliphilus TaxID=396056 RepID=A0A1I2RM59_9BACI|nr:sugar ABC transporter substrate-binding protein [Halobacillus alkaliphilus]SFG41755.1 carbohydrate ABC transporter substrate-binding protein, CUT1 family [Halobacillus alkaliphilus]
MKSWWKMFLVVGLVAGVLAACSGNSGNGGDESSGDEGGEPSGEITVWGWNVAAESMELAVDGFKEQYPDVEVKVEDIGRLDVYEKLTVGLASGGNGLPDVVMVESDRLANYYDQFPDALTNLSELGYDDHKDKFGEYKQSVTQNADGEFFAAPWDVGPTGVFYRTDIFEEAGVNPEDIKTWDDYIEAGKTIKEKTGTQMVPIDIAKDDALYRMMLNQQGAYYYDEEGNIDVTSEESKKAFEVIQQLENEELVLNNDGWNGVVSATVNGEVATVPFGVWYSGTIKDQAPDQDGQWGVFQLPAFEEGGNRAANLGGSDLVIPSSTDNQGAAYAFVEYFTTEVDPQMKALKEKGIFPSLNSAYEEEFFSQESEYFSNQQIYKLFSEEVADIPVANYTADYARAFDTMSDTQASILLDGTKIEDALQNAAEKLKSETGREVTE